MFFSPQRQDLSTATCPELARDPCALRFWLNLKEIRCLTTDPAKTGTLTINGADLPCIEYLKYFGSTILANGGLKHEVSARQRRLAEVALEN